MKPITISLACLTMLLVATSLRAAERPNIVLIYSDDQDYGQVGAYGSDIPTPHIDALAASGMMLDRYYVATALCAPSRWGLQNGAYASTAPTTMHEFPAGGAVNFKQDLGDVHNRPAEAWALPTTLKQAGYRTGFVGKYHLGFMGARIKPRTAELKDAAPDDPRLREELLHNFHLAQEGVLAGGYDFADGLYHDNPQPDNFYRSVMYHNQDWVTWHALRFLEQQNADQPFFLIMNSTIPHWPPPQDSLEADRSITPIGVVDFPEVQPSRASVLQRAAASGSRDKYAAGIIWLDDAVGALVQRLKDMGVYDNTLILFISDHSSRGKWSCDYGLAPAIAHWPGQVPAGVRSDALVQNVDIAPTLFDLVGVNPDAGFHLHGVSAWPVLSGTGPGQRSHAFMEINYQRAVISPDDIKYITVRFPPELQARHEAGEALRIDGSPAKREGEQVVLDALYDLGKDPRENDNLIDDTTYAEQAARMRALMQQQCMALPHAYGEFHPAEN